MGGSGKHILGCRCGPTPAPDEARGPGRGPGSSSPGGCGLSGLGCNATRRQTNVPKQQRRSGCCPTPGAKQRQPVRLARVWDTQGSGQGGAGVQPTCLCASFNQRHDAERAPRQRQANAHAQRGLSAQSGLNGSYNANPFCSALAESRRPLVSSLVVVLEPLLC